MKRGLEKSDGCFDARVSEILEQLQTACLEILAENLLGIYVHGSLAFGCFHWEISDIDVLLVTEQPPLQAEKEALLILENEQPWELARLELYALLLAIYVGRNVSDYIIPMHIKEAVRKI